MKKYKFPAWNYILPVIFFFGGAAMILFPINKIGHCIGIVAILLCIGFIWILIHPVIKIGEEELKMQENGTLVILASSKDIPILLRDTSYSGTKICILEDGMIKE